MFSLEELQAALVKQGPDGVATKCAVMLNNLAASTVRPDDKAFGVAEQFLLANAATIRSPVVTNVLAPHVG
jgi:hypothetical protein